MGPLLGLCLLAIAASPKLDGEISRMSAQPSEARLVQTVKTLVGFGTRHSCAKPPEAEANRGIGPAREWLRKELQAIPGLKVVSDPFPMPSCVPPGSGENLIGVLPGTDPTRLVLIGGHYDSLAFSGHPETREQERNSGVGVNAPGADDSGSQSALVLEAARSMAGHRFRATVLFVFFEGEEQGLVGSKALADHLATLFPGATLEAVLNCDIVGGDRSVNDDRTLHQYRLYAPGAPRETGRAPDGLFDGTSPSRGVQRFVGSWGGLYVSSMTAVPRLREDRLGRGGDHEPFIAHGIPGVRFIETQENVEHQHSQEDVLANLTPDYLKRMTEVVVASAAALARGLPAPTDFAAAPGAPDHWRVSWKPVAGAEHYVLAARPIGEQYYRRRLAEKGPQGEVSAADFGILSVEPFFISVAAVDREGHESLFAYPELRCENGTCAAPAGALQVTAIAQ